MSTMATDFLKVLFSLWKIRSGITHLDKTLSWITRVVLSSALLPSIFIIIAAALNRTYNADPSSVSITVPSQRKVSSHGINQVHTHPMQQSLALFFIIITGKVYALSLMHTINSRRAMRERFKSHDYGRTSLSRFQWSEPLTLVSSSDPSIPEVSRASLTQVGESTLIRPYVVKRNCGDLRA